ncbi:hypothetical protein Tco_0882980 [Tanacetum coccineum]
MSFGAYGDERVVGIIARAARSRSIKGINKWYQSLLRNFDPEENNYALWDVIENGNSFKPVAQTVEGSSTPHIRGPMTADEKIQKKNDVKARIMLPMALPNEHLMTFNQYKDAKSLFDAITTRFGGNDATRKT